MNQHDELMDRVASLEARVAALESQTPSGETLMSRPQDERETAETIRVQASNKRYDRGDYQEHIWFDCVFTALGLSRPARAVKGTLAFCDLFGAPNFIIGYTLNERLKPGQSVTVRGIGFEYNEFMTDHQWVLGTDLGDMTIRFRVDQILYDDGSIEKST